MWSLQIPVSLPTQNWCQRFQESLPRRAADSRWPLPPLMTLQLLAANAAPHILHSLLLPPLPHRMDFHCCSRPLPVATVRLSDFFHMSCSAVVHHQVALASDTWVMQSMESTLTIQFHIPATRPQMPANTHWLMVRCFCSQWKGS